VSIGISDFFAVLNFSILPILIGSGSYSFWLFYLFIFGERKDSCSGNAFVFEDLNGLWDFNNFLCVGDLQSYTCGAYLFPLSYLIKTAG